MLFVQSLLSPHIFFHNPTNGISTSPPQAAPYIKQATDVAAPVVNEGTKQVQKVVEPALKAIEPSAKVCYCDQLCVVGLLFVLFRAEFCLVCFAQHTNSIPRKDSQPCQDHICSSYTPLSHYTPFPQYTPLLHSSPPDHRILARLLRMPSSPQAWTPLSSTPPPKPSAPPQIPS